MRFLPVLFVFGASLVCASSAAPCSFAPGSPAKPTAIELIQRADVIVVAVAQELNLAARDHIRFEVAETLKGQTVGPLFVEGELTDGDDFNDLSASQNFVRPEGRRGTCNARSYRPGAAYLLFLQRTAAGELSPYWAPLSRVNDQIRPNGDQWLDWVRRQVAERR